MSAGTHRAGTAGPASATVLGRPAEITGVWARGRQVKGAGITA